MRVRIVVQHPFLSDVDIEASEPVIGLDGDRTRAQIDRMLANVAEQVRRAYAIAEAAPR